MISRTGQLMYGFVRYAVSWRGLVLLLVLSVLWYMGVDFALGQAAFVATYAVAGLGIALIVGQSGQLSLGQGALLGLGAYTQALLVLSGCPALLAFPCAVAAGALGGWLASLPARRLGGLYFGMSTLAFAMIVGEVLMRWDAVTRGAAGLVVPAFQIGAWSARSTLAQALVSAAILALAGWCCLRWCASGMGRNWRAVREDEVAAQACGIDTARAKMQAFIVGGGLLGLAGALYAHWIGFISPDQFGMLLSFELLMMVFIGGIRRLEGALWGALVMVAIPQCIALVCEILPERGENPAGLEMMLFGAVIVAVVLWRPQGIAGKRE